VSMMFILSPRNESRRCQGPAPAAIACTTTGGPGSELSAQFGHLVLEFDDALGADQSHAFAHQGRKSDDVPKLDTAVPPLPACRAGRTDDAFGVETADESRLHVEHRSGLADREERGNVVGHVDEVMNSTPPRRRRPAPAAHEPPAATAPREAPAELERGLPCSRNRSARINMIHTPFACHNRTTPFL
jgi:hypothetical protein